ncbi:hypothetical protein Rhopal_006252-T1 [Rhodotorula paludigena]|uniref:Mediator complex subunit 8 n=1 Tax=Rhodotorula paludigena TaxID=86838 RepID=A0AAV5GTG2_9BASI|nr:hypothetical protein Rhopal_006252-T1 [Rhodotorula paludigena]
MQPSLAAHLSSRTSRAPTPAQGSSSASTATAHPDLDPLRLRLVQLIDAVTVLHSQLSYLAFHAPTPSSANPGTLPFADLVARYSLLVTHLAALQGLLSSEQDRDKELERERAEGASGGAAGRRRRAERERDHKREKWDALSVVPAEKVDEAKDWIVGMLLRTKQTPEVEASQQALLASLPEPFSSALSSAPSTFPALAADHARLVSLAYDKVLALKEFNSENEEWDWKARVELDDDDADDEDGGLGEKMQVEAQGAGALAWTPQEVQAYLRTGKKPAN